VKLPGRSPVRKVLQASSEISSKMRGYKGGRSRSFCLRNKEGAFYTLVVQLLPMVRPEFPTTPINASIKSDTSPAEQSPFVQPTLEGIELEQTPEIELGNCIVTSSVRFRKLVRGNEWHCTIQAVPDLLHPEQEGDFEAQAYQGYADMAKDARLRPGDRAVMRGTLQQQTIALENGQTSLINHFSVTYIEVISRSKRTSITAYEKEKGT
jgi:hypothetical protein